MSDRPASLLVPAISVAGFAKVVVLAAILALSACGPYEEEQGPPCPWTHQEERKRHDDRPHKQGGRGGMITYHVTVCDPPPATERQPAVTEEGHNG